MIQIIKIKTNYISLGQFLKLINVISTGGLSKIYLLKNVVLVNDQLEKRRGRKLFDGDKIFVNNHTYKINVSC